MELAEVSVWLLFVRAYPLPNGFAPRCPLALPVFFFFFCLKGEGQRGEVTCSIRFDQSCRANFDSRALPLGREEREGIRDGGNNLPSGTIGPQPT